MKKAPIKKQKTKSGISLIEMLLALAILSVCLYPIAYITCIANTVSPGITQSDDECLATLLAHHIMETIIAKRGCNSAYLPSMSKQAPVVQTSAGEINEYFKDFSDSNPKTVTADKQLLEKLSKFSCSVDTYYLDDNMFKVIVYVTYKRDGREIKTFFERLFTQGDIVVDESD